MNNEEHDDLWRLLGKAKEPAVSPFFARNVLRAIRVEKQEKIGFLAWLLRRRAVLAGFALLVLTATGVTSWQRSQRHEQITVLAEEVSASADYTVISDLDELLAYEENSAWLEKSVF